MRLKLDLSLPKLLKLRLGLQIGLAAGARVDVRLRLRGGEPIRWKAALARGTTRQPEQPVTATLLVPPGELPRA